MNKQQEFQKLVKTIERSNDKFSQASRSQKILMVARDVLKMLELNRIQATKGSYVVIPALQQEGEEKKGSCQLSDILKMPELPTCNVCAIGGAMVATTLRLNKVKVDCQKVFGRGFLYQDREDRSDKGLSFKTDYDMSIRTESVFPNILLRVMESAFEIGSFGYETETDSRLRNIYQNLVDNKGRKFTWYKQPERVIYTVKD